MVTKKAELNFFRSQKHNLLLDTGNYIQRHPGFKILYLCAKDVSNKFQIIHQQKKFSLKFGVKFWNIVLYRAVVVGSCLIIRVIESRVLINSTILFSQNFFMIFHKKLCFILLYQFSLIRIARSKNPQNDKYVSEKAMNIQQPSQIGM